MNIEILRTGRLQYMVLKSKYLFVVQAVVITAFVFSSTAAWGVATQTESTLEVTGSVILDSIEIKVGPSVGQVTLSGADGRVFTSVSDLVVSTLQGDDSLKFFIESSDARIAVDTWLGADSVGIEMVTPPRVSQASAIFSFDTGTGDDVVEVKFDSSASLFDIAMSFTRLTATVETAKVEFEQQVPGTVAMNLSADEAFVLGNFSLIAKGPGVFILNGEVRSQEQRVIIFYAG